MDETAEPTLAEIARRIRAGDSEAETMLVQRLSSRVRELLRYRTHDRDLADDHFQETFRIVIERLRNGGVDEPDKLEAFVCGVARKVALGHYSREQRRATTANSPVVEIAVDERANQLDDLIRQEQLRIARKFIAELPVERDRELLTRYYLSDQEKAVICSELGVNSRHFDKILHRARKRLQKVAAKHRNKKGRE